MRYSVAAALIICMVVLIISASADIPQIINYQGKVTDIGGIPVADGTYEIRFRIYNDPTAGTLLWDDTHSSVQITDGVFNVALGESPLDPIDLAFDQDYWLLVTIAGDDQAPRQRLGSVGYAYMTSGLVPGTEVSGSITTGTMSAIKAVNSATVGINYGMYGSSNSVEGRAVYGYASATGGYNRGVHGESASDNGTGVYGYASSTDEEADTYGVRGECASGAGYGVYGLATATFGSTRGVYGQNYSSDGTGVSGVSPKYGVSGNAIATTGNTYGMYGTCESTDGRGVYGSANVSTGTAYGVYGRTLSPSGYGVYYEGGLGGSGAMRTIVRTSQGPTAIEAVTATGNWIEDFGEGQLVNGRCHVELDPLFLETVTIDESNPMKVFVELCGNCKGVYVEKGFSHFDVVELQNGRSSITFDYRVVAKRKGFEDNRLDYCKAGEADSFLYPEHRDKE